MNYYVITSDMEKRIYNNKHHEVMPLLVYDEMCFIFSEQKIELFKEWYMMK